MGRAVIPRKDYLKDALSIRRLISAVEADQTASTEWKEQLDGHLRGALRMMLEREPNADGSDKSKG